MRRAACIKKVNCLRVLLEADLDGVLAESLARAVQAVLANVATHTLLGGLAAHTVTTAAAGEVGAYLFVGYKIKTEI